MHLHQLQQRPLATPPLQSTALTALPRRVRRGRTQQPCVAGAGFVVGGASSSNLQTLSHLVSAVSLAIGAWWVSSELLREEEPVGGENTRECPTCNGTGYVECMCSKWSDKDVGCSACQGSGAMRCSSCGGGGRAVPITSKLYNRGTRRPPQ